MVIENQYMTVFHEKDAYWGCYKDSLAGFHIFFNSHSNGVIGRFDPLVGNVKVMLLEDQASSRFTFQEKKRDYKVVTKDGKLKVGTMQFNGYVVTNPLTFDAISKATSKDLINCYVDYESVCDFNYDFGVGWRQSIRSRDDYYQLFRRRYDLKKIIFSDWLPSAASMFKCFENCFSLEEIDITKVQGSATVFTRCFANCKSLKKLKMNKTKNSCRIGGMFSGCLSIENIEFPFEELSACKRWRYDTDKVNDIRCPLMNGFMRMLN